MDASGRSRKELAEELDISEPYLNALCRGKRVRPNPVLVEKISHLTKGEITNAYWAERTPERNVGSKKRTRKAKRKR